MSEVAQRQPCAGCDKVTYLIAMSNGRMYCWRCAEEVEALGIATRGIPDADAIFLSLRVPGDVAIDQITKVLADIGVTVTGVHRPGGR